MENLNVPNYGSVGETSQMSNSSHEINRRPGMPPPYPNNPQLQMLSPRPKSNTRVSHYRSLSHSSVFDSLPPLPPLSPTNPLSYHRDSSPVSFVADPNLTNVSVVGERAGNSQHGLLDTPSLVNRVDASNGIEMMIPPKRHQRCFSGSPMGLSSMINRSSPQLMPNESSRGASSDVLVSERENWASQKPIQLVKRQSEWKSEDGKDNVEGIVSSYLNLENIDALNGSRKANGCESSDKKAGNRETNATSMGFQFQGASTSVPRGRRGGRKRRAAGGDIDPTGEHCRTVSMDNAATQTRADQLSLDEKLAIFGGKFNVAELKKVLAEDKLSQLALSDPKRVKRILANRESAARSKLNSAKKVAELEQEIQAKETELAEMSANQSEPVELASEYNELKCHIQAIDQLAQQRYDLNDIYITELHRLQHSIKEMTSNTNIMDHDIDRMDREIDRIDYDMANKHPADLMGQQLFIDNENIRSPDHHRQQHDPPSDQFQEKLSLNKFDIPESK
ncbi:hypothetical protein Ddye_007210 [Dipteronia dyeriana]|uniref:BZIP domain-containing protein n=1 Tax=Dipteronia dyeriana TaxID=168575 RepID=A0AAD9XK50_9ROSI|nr:hypothetical protein Ddye_007210 [Dipteronia dyeriana]